MESLSKTHNFFHFQFSEDNSYFGSLTEELVVCALQVFCAVGHLGGRVRIPKKGVGSN